MQSTRRSTVFAALLAASGAAVAASASLNESRPGVLPVLVQVNAHGKVTGASPAMELSPRLRRLLRANLDEMIRLQATDKHGRPVSSQFIMNLALRTSPRANGQLDAHFAYVSAVPVPAGSWYWVHLDDHRLALARQGSTYLSPRRPPMRELRESAHPGYRQPPAPVVDNAVRSAPAAAPAHGPGQGR